MNSPKKTKSRKPSVLVSRQFSCAHAFGGDQTNTKGSMQKSGLDETMPKIIWNGKDVTPQPLLVDMDSNGDGDYKNFPSLDEISGFLENFEDETVDNKSDLENAGIPWIPKKMSELYTNCEELFHVSLINIISIKS